MESLLNFLHQESLGSSFRAELSERGGYVTFSNSGRRGETKFFQIGLDTLLTTLKDMLTNLSVFSRIQDYDERPWRENGSLYFSDAVANANSTVQTKPLFSTLSKIIKWANQPALDRVNTDSHIKITRETLETTISKLNVVAESFAPHIPTKMKKIPLNDPLQQIFFGTPGTGKSHTIKEACKTHEHFRITFHPDTDYASFVGAYKPFTEEEYVYHTILAKNGAEALPVINPETNKPITTSKITYKFVQQAFLKAYVAAWKEQEKEEPKPVFLVIEEINRGNCAQIFGDIFQLLDRNEEGFSDYPIHADTDLSKELAKAFADLHVTNAEGINALYDGKDIVGEVKKGTQLLLPNNLYIWATMNTSDQSLFPIDSAFKRRWEWKYIKIADAGKGYVISVNDKEYDWWQFLQAINKHIGDTTSQEDKKLGYFFAKAIRNEDGKHVISADKFLSKVLFFLYGDVYKDYGFDDSIFRGEDGTAMEFSDYFDETGKAIEGRIELFLRNLKLKAIGEAKDAGPKDIVEDTEVL